MISGLDVQYRLFLERIVVEDSFLKKGKYLSLKLEKFKHYITKEEITGRFTETVIQEMNKREGSTKTILK